MEIPANVRSSAPNSSLQTGLAMGGHSRDVEHLLAGAPLHGRGQRRRRAQPSRAAHHGRQLGPWVYLIQDAGVKTLNVARKAIQINRPIQIQDGDKRIALYPFDGFKISYTINFDHPMLRHQQKTMDLDEQVFIDQIAPARTFGFLKEVEFLRQRGLAMGGSFENSIVLGETGVLNPLRFEDEFVRHKILDAVGDMALLGHPIQGHLVVHRGGHALHTAFAAKCCSRPTPGRSLTRRHLPMSVRKRQPRSRFGKPASFRPRVQSRVPVIPCVRVVQREAASTLCRVSRKPSSCRLNRS
jgi:UDP-3-O-[3-hydroxymyristoyl] N-acetylglucosamine deacetylase